MNNQPSLYFIYQSRYLDFKIFSYVTCEEGIPHTGILLLLEEPGVECGKRAFYFDKK